MPTTFQFGRCYANVPDSSSFVSSPRDVTVTAVIDDGAIDVGDLVVIDDISGTGVSGQSGIEDGDQVYYLGRLDLGDGTSGYIFSSYPSLAEAAAAETKLVVLTDSDDRFSATAQITFGSFLADVLEPGTDVPDLASDPACFLEGTLITTTMGEIPIEDLTPGDLLVTPDGREIPLMFVGRQTIGTPFGIPQRLRPVRIAAGSLAEGVPKRDLVVTADHALFIDGLLIQAAALVNSKGIQWAPLTSLEPMFRVYHVETDEHDVILAEGCPAETYLGARQRREFDNFEEYKLHYPRERILKELPYNRVAFVRLVPKHIRDHMEISKGFATRTAIP